MSAAQGAHAVDRVKGIHTDTAAHAAVAADSDALAGTKRKRDAEITCTGNGKSIADETVRVGAQEAVEHEEEHEEDEDEEQDADEGTNAQDDWKAALNAGHLDDDTTVVPSVKAVKKPAAPGPGSAAAPSDRTANKSLREAAAVVGDEEREDQRDESADDTATAAPTMTQGNSFLLRMTFVNPDALHKWAQTTTKKTTKALLRFVSDPKAPFHGVVMECREAAVKDNVALVSQFKCAVEGGCDVRGVPVSRESLDNEFEFVVNTAQIVKCVAGVKEKGALITATIYTEITTDKRKIRGLDAGLVWECFGATGESCTQWSQPIESAAEVREGMPDLGECFEMAKVDFPVKFGVNVPPLIQLFKAANGEKATDATITLNEARVSVAAAQRHRSSSGGKFLEIRHWSLNLSFNTTLTPVPLSRTLYVTMGTISAECCEHIVDVSTEERAKLKWNTVCTNAYKIEPLLTFLQSCGSDNGRIMLSTGEDRNSQPFTMSVDCGDNSSHFVMVGPSFVVDDTAT